MPLFKKLLNKINPISLIKKGVTYVKSKINKSPVVNTVSIFEDEIKPIPFHKKAINYIKSKFIKASIVKREPIFEDKDTNLTIFEDEIKPIPFHKKAINYIKSKFIKASIVKREPIFEDKDTNLTIFEDELHDIVEAMGDFEDENKSIVLIGLEENYKSNNVAYFESLSNVKKSSVNKYLSIRKFIQDLPKNLPVISFLEQYQSYLVENKLKFQVGSDVYSKKVNYVFRNYINDCVNSGQKFSFWYIDHSLRVDDESVTETQEQYLSTDIMNADSIYGLDGLCKFITNVYRSKENLAEIDSDDVRGGIDYINCFYTIQEVDIGEDKVANRNPGGSHFEWSNKNLEKDLRHLQIYWDIESEYWLPEDDDQGPLYDPSFEPGFESWKEKAAREKRAKNLTDDERLEIQQKLAAREARDVERKIRATNCFVFALKESKILSDDIIRNIESRLLANYASLRDVDRIGIEHKIKINLHQYETCKKASGGKKQKCIPRGDLTSNVVVNLALYKKHFFINDELPEHLQNYLDNRSVPIKTPLSLIHHMFENGEFSPISYNTVKRSRDFYTSVHKKRVTTSDLKYACNLPDKVKKEPYKPKYETFTELCIFVADFETVKDIQLEPNDNRYGKHIPNLISVKHKDIVYKMEDEKESNIISDNEDDDEFPIVYADKTRTIHDDDDDDDCDYDDCDNIEVVNEKREETKLNAYKIKTINDKDGRKFVCEEKKKIFTEETIVKNETFLGINSPEMFLDYVTMKSIDFKKNCLEYKYEPVEESAIANLYRNKKTGKEVKLYFKTIVYYHNLKYDFTFLFDYFKAVSLTELNNSLYGGDCDYPIKDINGNKTNFTHTISFKDSMKIINSSAANIAKSFKLSCKKELMCYNLYDTNFCKEGMKMDSYLSVKEALKELCGKVYISDKNQRKAEKINIKKEFVSNLEELNFLSFSKDGVNMESYLSVKEILNGLYGKIYISDETKRDEEIEKFKNEFIKKLIRENSLFFKAYDYLKFYCDQDVDIIYQALDLLNVTLDSLGLNVHKKLSISGLAHQVMIEGGAYENVNESNGTILRYIDQSKKGGRCGTKHGEQHDIKGRVVVTDANSLYPSAGLRLCQDGYGVPIGKPRYLDNNVLLNKMKKYKVEIEVLSYKPTNDKDKNKIDIGTILTVKKSKLKRLVVNNKLEYKIIKGIDFIDKTEIFFDINILLSKLQYYVVDIEVLSCENEYDISMMSYTDPITKNIVNDALPVGTIITVGKIGLEDYVKYHNLKYKFIQGIEYYQGFNTKCGAIISRLYDMRMEYKAEGNVAAEQTIKLLLNSIYGRSIMKPSKTRNYYLDQCDLAGVIGRDSSIIKEIICLNKELVKVVKYQSFDKHTNYNIFGTMILEMSKRIMNEVTYCCHLTKTPVNYIDTDSIHSVIYQIGDTDNFSLLAVKYKELYKDANGNGKELFGDQLGQFSSDLKMGVGVKNVEGTREIICSKKKYYQRLHGFKDGVEVWSEHYCMLSVQQSVIRGTSMLPIYQVYKENGCETPIEYLYQLIFQGHEIPFNIAKYAPIFKHNGLNEIRSLTKGVKKIKSNIYVKTKEQEPLFES